MTPDPEKSAKFHEMKEIRLPNALKQIEMVGKLGKSKVVEYTPLEAEGMIDVLDLAVSAAAEQLGVTRIKDTDSESSGQEYSEFEMAEEPFEEPEASAPDAPRTMSQGPLELSKEENLYLLKNFDGTSAVGVQIGTALEALIDSKSSDPNVVRAKDLLLNLMRS